MLITYMMSSIFGVNLGRGARFEAVTVVLLRIQVFWDVTCRWASASWPFKGTLILLNMGTILSTTWHHFPENLNLCQQMVNRIVPLCSQRANAGKHSIQASILVAQFSIYGFCFNFFFWWCKCVTMIWQYSGNIDTFNFVTIIIVNLVQ